MDADDGITTRPNSVEEMPEPFRSALRDRLSPADSVQFLAFRPATTSQGIRVPATLLTLTDRRWLVVSDDEYGTAAVVESAFDNTLLVELTEILLQGQLKLDFVGRGRTHSCVIEFDAVDGKLYREAVRRILRGIEGESPASSDKSAAVPVIEMRPITFRNAVPSALAEGRRPVAGVQWPAVFGVYGRELAPAAALLTTGHELVLVAEKRVGIRVPARAKYGYVVTYFPLARLAGFGLRRNERYVTGELDIRASRAGETFQILFPTRCQQEVTQVLECALNMFQELSMKCTAPLAGGP